ncbi:MAG: hypothetical protein Q4C13_04685 [Clostridia bacterium]|nr:hypothetical protein [Clostridia bacterium]
MDEGLSVRVDKQVMSLLTISVWFNLICIVLLAALNLVRFFRGDFGAAPEEGASGGLFSSETLLLLCVVCAVWLVLRTLNLLRVRRRMEQVYLRVGGGAVSGVSLPEPSRASREYPNGRPFTLDIASLTEVSSKEIVIVGKQLAPALMLKAGEAGYVVPGIANLEEIKKRLQQGMEAARAQEQAAAPEDRGPERTPFGR